MRWLKFFTFYDCHYIGIAPIGKCVGLFERLLETLFWYSVLTSAKVPIIVIKNPISGSPFFVYWGGSNRVSRIFVYLCLGWNLTNSYCIAFDHIWSPARDNFILRALNREPAFPFYRAYGLDANSNGTDKSVNILPARVMEFFMYDQNSLASWWEFSERPRPSPGYSTAQCCKLLANNLCLYCNVIVGKPAPRTTRNESRLYSFQKTLQISHHNQTRVPIPLHCIYSWWTSWTHVRTLKWIISRIFTQSNFYSIEILDV
jgi:hypothetical protein